MFQLASFFRRPAVPLAAFGALIAANLSCADNGTSLYVIGVLTKDRPECSYSASASSSILLRGVLDVAFGFEYQAGLLIGSQLQARGQSSTLRTEPNHFQFQGAEVQLSDIDGDIPNGYFTVSSTGFVEAAQGESEGLGVMSATLIPDVVGFDISQELDAEGFGARKEVIARVRVFGKTLSGVTVDSGEFLYPIDVCLGCLIYFPLEAIDIDAAGNATCVGNPEGADPIPCLPLGVDSGIDCRNCSRNPFCRTP